MNDSNSAEQAQAKRDMVVRLRLRQAFGRLIRRAGDSGTFVILDPRLASRFTTAFPAASTITSQTCQTVPTDSLFARKR